MEIVKLPMRNTLKITVIKKLSGEDIYGKKLPITPKYPLVCDRMDIGKEFIVEDKGAMPQGFCPWAWNDIARLVDHLQFNGDFPFYVEKGMALACCTDAVRPVIFKLERLER